MKENNKIVIVEIPPPLLNMFNFNAPDAILSDGIPVVIKTKRTIPVNTQEYWYRKALDGEW